MNLNERISKNFKWWEMFNSNTAKRNNIYNYTSSTIVQNNIINVVTNVIQPVRNEFGSIRIQSAYRSPELNKLVGGSPTSNHIFGEAIDFTPYRSVPLMEILEFINDTLEFRELIAEYFPGGWIHVSYRQGHNTKTLKLKDRSHPYSKVSLDYIKKLYK